MNADITATGTTQFEVFERTADYVIQVKTKIIGRTLAINVLQFTRYGGLKGGYLQGSVQIRNQLVVLIAGFDIDYTRDSAMAALATNMRERIELLTGGEME